MELGYVPKKKNRKKMGNFKIINYNRKKMFDKNGMLKISKVKK